MSKLYAKITRPLVIPLCLVSILSAEAADEVWSLNFESPILWQKITPLGNIVVNTKDGLFGVDQSNGEITWEIASVGRVPEENYEIIPGTLFAQISTTFGVTIIDPWVGTILFNSKDAGLSILTKNILFEGGTLLVYGTKKPLKFTLVMIDIGTGKILWDNSELFSGGKKGFGGFVSAMQNVPTGEDGGDDAQTAFDLVENGPDEFVIATKTGLYKISTKSGEQLWKSGLPKPKGAVSGPDNPRLLPSSGGNSFYYANYNYIQAYDMQTGKQIWGSPHKMSGIANFNINTSNGLLILPALNPSNNISAPAANLIDYSTGTGQWGNKNKGVKLSGGVTGYRFIGDDLILTMENKGNSYLNIIDITTGKLKYDKALKLKGFLDYTEMTPSGLLFVTLPDPNSNGEINIYDLGSGKQKFSKSITSGKPLNSDKFDPRKFALLTAFTNDKVYVFSNKDNTLYEVDKNAGTFKILNDEIKLEGKEKASDLELRDTGLVLVSEQNVIGLDLQGKERFRQYYPAPDNPGWMKALYALESINAALVSAQAAMISGAMQATGSKTSDPVAASLATEVGGAYDQYSDQARAYSKAAMGQAKKRFKSSANTSDNVFMMTQLGKKKSGVSKAFEQRQFGLVQVSKINGEIVDMVDMDNDKDPTYQVDNIENAIYYQVSDREIKCYRF